MTEYVAGFMFSPCGSMVVLIRKDRPKWQAGCLNGVGGKTERGESPCVAMSREFSEETGVETQPADWEEFATLCGPNFTVHMMRTRSDEWHRVRTMESEDVRGYPVFGLRQGTFDPVVRNLSFLIPLALDDTLQVPIILRDAQPDEARAA